MSIYEIQPVLLGGVRTYLIAARKSKVSVRDFARPVGKNTSVKKFLGSLPSILPGVELLLILARSCRVLIKVALNAGIP